MSSYFIWFRQSDENQNITGTVEMYFRISRKPTDAQKDGVACDKDGPFQLLLLTHSLKNEEKKSGGLSPEF